MSAARLAPVAGSERVELIDILRGFALLGILTVNFWGTGGEGTRRLDLIVSKTLDIVVSSSFYPLFSFLFGLGFAVQLMRARERGAGIVLTYVRRMLALFLIGAFHAIVIWNGDILTWYALFGVVLIPLHRLGDRWLLALAALPLIALLWMPAVSGFLGRIGGEPAAEARFLRTLAANQRSFTATLVPERFEYDPNASRIDSFTSATAARWSQFQFTVRMILSRDGILFDIPAFFLIGFVVGRRRILQEAERHRTGLTAAAVIGLASAVTGSLVLYVVKPTSPVLEALARGGSDYGATVFYVTSIALGVTFVPAIARAFRRFGPAGRIGLTNYLLQSVTMTLLFSHYGASLTRPSTALWLLINLLFFFGVQLPLSAWYVRRFRFGPAEWLWRSMTYGSRQPMRVEETPAAQPLIA